MSDAPPAEYMAGVCNIGGAEVAARRRTAIAATVGSAVLATGLVAGRAPRAARALVGIPIAGTAVAWLQVRDRFCVAYAAQGVENVARPLGATAAVTDPEARRADRRRAAQMGAKGALIGVVGAIVMWLIPV